MFLTGERSKMVNHRLWRIEEMLTEYPRSSSARSYPQGLENCVRINRSEIVNLDCVDGFERRSAFLLWQASPIVAERPLGLSKNCYYIGKNPLYATGDYRQRMECVFIKAKQQ